MKSIKFWGNKSPPKKRVDQKYFLKHVNVKLKNFLSHFLNFPHRLLRVLPSAGRAEPGLWDFGTSGFGVFLSLSLETNLA